jgi:Uma2 family endonuclease
MPTVLSPPEARVILHNISWSLYEQLLAEHEEKSSPRFVYDRGELEITVPSYEHEELNRLIDNCIAILAMEWNIEDCNAGSTTFKREDLERGFEPDSCFYVQHAAQITGKKRLDLTVDPPPDLVLEVDVTHPSLDKLSIFVVVGVPEVWRYDGERVRMLALAGDSYVEREQSLAFPALRSAHLAELLTASQQMPRTAWLRHVRAWAQGAPRSPRA